MTSISKFEEFMTSFRNKAETHVREVREAGRTNNSVQKLKRAQAKVLKERTVEHSSELLSLTKQLITNAEAAVKSLKDQQPAAAEILRKSIKDVRTVITKIESHKP